MTAPRRVAFVTCRALPEGSPDDRLAAAACAEWGVEAESGPWESRGAAWEAFDAEVVRSAWTYHRMPRRFDRWLDRLEEAGVRAFNDVATMRWNASKRYLFDREREGVPVIPSVWVEEPRGLDAGAIERAVGTVDVVAKPAVGASAEGVRRVRAGRAEDLEWLGTALADGPLLVQSYVPEVAARGEWSVVHLGGAYSHAVLKTPARGDFRVQEALGASTRAEDPPAEVREIAARAIAVAGAVADAGGSPLYARVDAVEVADGPLLVELELIEPSLFFAHAPGSADRFADAPVAALEAP